MNNTSSFRATRRIATEYYMFLPVCRWSFVCIVRCVNDYKSGTSFPARTRSMWRAGACRNQFIVSGGRQKRDSNSLSHHYVSIGLLKNFPGNGQIVSCYLPWGQHAVENSWRTFRFRLCWRGDNHLLEARKGRRTLRRKRKMIRTSIQRPRVRLYVNDSQLKVWLNIMREAMGRG